MEIDEFVDVAGVLETVELTEMADKDLLRILINRTVRKSKLFAKMLSKNYLWIDDENYLTRFAIGTRQLELLDREVKSYKEKNISSAYLDDIKLAREGDDKSLCQIIEWDKEWLYVPWVKERILIANERKTDELLPKVGKAIARKSKRKRNIHSKYLQEEELIMIDAVITSWIAENPGKDPKEIVDDLLKVMAKYWDENTDEPIPFATDKDYLIKYLRRHDVI
jgi:hypothetical protein